MDENIGSKYFYSCYVCRWSNFFISGLLFSFAIITKKETKSSYATVNLPWYKGKVLMPGWVGNIIGAVVCLSVGTYLLYLWAQWDIFSNF